MAEGFARARRRQVCALHLPANNTGPNVSLPGRSECLLFTTKTDQVVKACCDSFEAEYEFGVE